MIHVKPYHSPVMIIGGNVSYYEEQNQRFFSGSKDKWFHREFQDITGMRLDQCYVTKAVKTFNPKKPTTAEMKVWKEELLKEIRAVKPKYILLLGATALKAVHGNSSLTSMQGKVFDFEGAKCLTTFDPGAVIRQPGHGWQFRSELTYFKRLVEGQSHIPKNFDYTFVDTWNKLDDMTRHLLAHKEFSYDIETTQLDPQGGQCLMIGFSTSARQFVIPLEVNFRLRTALGIEFGFKEAYEIIKPFLEKDTRFFHIAQNAKFDNRWLRLRGIEPYIDFDTFLASYVLNVTVPHGLKYMAKTYLGAMDYDQDIEFKENLTMQEFHRMAQYCALDVYYTYNLYPIFMQELQKNKALMNVFKYIVMPGERVLQKIEERGVYVDPLKVLAVQQDYEAKRQACDDELENLLPQDFKGMNFNSPKQLAELLFGKLKLPILERSPAGAPSTGKSVLLRLVDKHPIPKLILERRKYDKAINGFLEPWSEYLLNGDGRLHTTYNIAKTATGRLSAENPNLQQVPRDKNVRNLISVPPGKKFIEADYSQIELRAAAYVAGSETMKELYRQGADIHRKTASEVAGIKPEDVTYEQRTGAKAVNFGYLYGMWWKSFKSYAFDTYGVVVTDQEAEASRNAYFNAYPELLPWHARQCREVKAYRKVTTPTGRVRHLPNIDSPDKDLRGSAERQAINTPVQSFASDMTLLAMILIDKMLDKDYKGQAYLVGQVHDAIMVEVDEEIGEEVGRRMKSIMEDIPKVLKKYFGLNFDLPLVADVEIGEAWGKTEEIKFSQETS